MQILSVQETINRLMLFRGRLWYRCAWQRMRKDKHLQESLSVVHERQRHKGHGTSVESHVSWLWTMFLPGYMLMLDNKIPYASYMPFLKHFLLLADFPSWFFFLLRLHDPTICFPVFLLISMTDEFIFVHHSPQTIKCLFSPCSNKSSLEITLSS